MPADWESQKEIFYSALALAIEERGRFLDQACAGDSGLRSEIERLIEYHAQGREFFLNLEQELGATDSRPHLFADAEIVAGRFEILRFLARGGFAEVYEALDRELEERVALKVLRGSWISAEAIERFKTEVRLARKIQSVHVCRVHDVGRFDRGDGSTILFFSMELLEGETLSQLVRRSGPLKSEDALSFLRDIAQGLQAAHQLGFLHRDLKSANIMLVPEATGPRRAVLTDFGLAITADRDVQQHLAGTPGYMAPEQLAGRPLSVQTDVYSLGVIAFEMVTGRLPFPSMSPMEAAQTQRSGRPSPPSAIEPSVRRRWDVAILKCLSRNPEDRFANAVAFIEALSPRRKVSTIGTFSIALIMAGTAVWWSKMRDPVTPVTSGSVLVVPFELNGTMDKWQVDSFSDDLTSELAAVPGVRVVAQSTAREWAGKAKNYAEIRRHLHAASVLSGSIQSISGATRVAIQLVDSSSGYLLWSHDFDTVPRDLPHVEETIVLASVQALHASLPAFQVDNIRARHSQVYEAYQAYSFGQFCAARRNTQDLEQAIKSFSKATETDPGYALAYAGLAGAYSMIASRGTMPHAEALRLSDAAVTEALELEPDLPEALLVKGLNLQDDNWDWDGAERYFRRCIEVAPNLSIAHQWLAGLLSIRGRHAEALAEASLARNLDPLSPAVNASYGTFLYRARRYAEAIDQLEWVVKREPTFSNAKLLLADVYSQVGRPQDAIPLAEAVVADEGRASYALAELGYLYGRAGRLEEARTIASELEMRFAEGDARPSEVASVYYGQGMPILAFDWLERGLPLRDAGLTVLKSDPSYDGLRVFPRYYSLISTLKL
jgi:serine/threonine-protein kinase